MDGRAPYASIAWSSGRACRDFAGAGALHFRCYRRCVRYRHFFVRRPGSCSTVFSSVLHRFHMHVSASYSSLPCRFTRQNRDGFFEPPVSSGPRCQCLPGRRRCSSRIRPFPLPASDRNPNWPPALTRRFECCDERNPRFGLHAIRAAKCRNWNVSG